MKQGLFVNSKKATCSIYESGLMVYNILKNSSLYDLYYFENSRLINTPKTVEDPVPNGYDFYVINWHCSVNAIPINIINKLTGVKICPVFEVETGDNFTLTPRDLFDIYMIIDPTKEQKSNLYPFPRPLEIIVNPKPLLDNTKLVIGSFGLHIPGKKFEEIIDVASSLKEECIIRINIYQGKYVGYQHLNLYFNHLAKKARGGMIDLRLTSEYMDKQELISWCSEHTINSFPYYRNSSGLAATTDQAISAGRAIAITSCNTFRHMHPYISHYPKQNYLELIESTPIGVKQMQEDWHPNIFLKKFEEVLTDGKVL